MIRFRYILSLFILFTYNLLPAQPISRYNTFSYNVNEGLLQSTVIDMAFDKNNFCWLSFPNGVQRFDGKDFITVPIQTGLPEDKWVKFFRTSQHELLISHAAGISKYETSGNRFTLVYKKEAPLETPATFIGEDDNIIYIYDKTGSITGLDAHTFKIISETLTGLPGYPSPELRNLRFSNNIIDHKIAILINSTLYLWNLQKRKLLYQSKNFSDISIYFLLLKTGSEVLYQEFTGGTNLQLYNFITSSSAAVLTREKANKPLPWRSIMYHWQEKLLFSVNNNIYEMDTSLQVFKSELVNFQNQPAAGVSPVARIKEDNFGNLFIGTVTNGIKKIIRNNYPIKYYGTLDKDKNFTLCILPDKRNNRVLVGTTANGLLVFDTLQRLIKDIHSLPGRKDKFAINAMVQDKKGNYFLFVPGERSVWKLSHDLSDLVPVTINSSLLYNERGISYFGTALFADEKKAIIHSQNKLYTISFDNNSVAETKATRTNPMSALVYGSYIITHTNDELVFFDAGTHSEIKKISFKNTGQVRCFATDEARRIYMGCNKGVFIIDSTGKILTHFDKTTGLPDECIYAMTFDKDGSLWCSSNKGIFRINKDNSILQLTKDDGLQENEFNTNAVTQAEDGEIFFGGVNGVSSFYPSAISSFEDKPGILITGLKVNNKDYFKDTASWMLSKITLPYNKNSFSFDFVAMGAGNPEQYVYQYKMDGLDKEWIQNSGTQTVRYFLQPGKYTFQVYASRQFDSKAKPLKEIIIVIRPPFWKTWWFLAIAGLLFISLLAFIINQNNKRKYAKQLQQLENERQLKLERERISKDLHDNLGAYANAILYNTDMLEKETVEEKRKQLITHLKFSSKDIITSLRETIWALNKETYTAEDCLLRIRNFIQQLSRYYTEINFSVDGMAPANKDFHYSKALNLVRIVQEAISNSIKHAGAKNITLRSLPRDNKWELVISDDGKGFDYDARKKLETGNGLVNMQRRADTSGFYFTVTSNEDKGTVITFIA